MSQDPQVEVADGTADILCSLYEKLAGSTAIYPNRGENLTYAVLGLVSEAGELASLVKKSIRDNNGVLSDAARDAAIKEAGDVAWYLAAIAYELRTPLSHILWSNVMKLAGRKERGTLMGSGDDR